MTWLKMNYFSFCTWPLTVQMTKCTWEIAFLLWGGWIVGQHRAWLVGLIRDGCRVNVGERGGLKSLLQQDFPWTVVFAIITQTTLCTNLNCICSQTTGSIKGPHSWIYPVPVSQTSYFPWSLVSQYSYRPGRKGMLCSSCCKSPNKVTASFNV